MKKIIKLLMLTMIMIVGITSIVKVEASTNAPSTITMGNGQQLSNYIGETYFPTKITNDGKYAYCIDKNLKTPNGLEMKLVEAKDAGIAYIMTNGYPAKSITGNSKYDYYITQTALWWYLDDTTGANNLGNGFKVTGADPYGLRKHVISLKEEAKKAKDTGYTKPIISLSVDSNEFTLSSDGKYYYSSDITVTSKSTTGNITLSLENAPKNATIVDTNGNVKTSVASGTKVRVKVPADSVSSLETTMTINASATGKIDKVYMYEPSNDDYQPVVISVLYSETETINTNKKLILKRTKVEIIKVDGETDEALSGATFVIKNSKGEEIETWTSTTEGHEIVGLPEGNYIIEELKAPDGYIKSDQKYNVTLEAGKQVTVKIYNKKEVIEVESIIQISKVNGETGEALAGATLVLKDANGQEVVTWETTTEDYIIENIKPGTYYLSEISAPEGFILSTEVVEIVVTEDGGTVIVTFYNTPEIKVPNTSSSISKTIIALGALVTVIGGNIIFITLRKEEN